MINYTSERLGTLYIKRDGKKYAIQIRRGNCLAVFVYVYRQNKKWLHQLYNFFNDEEHIKNIIKNCNGDLFDDEVVSVELNTYYYKDVMKLIKHMAKCKYNINCYYKEPTEK